MKNWIFILTVLAVFATGIFVFEKQKHNFSSQSISDPKVESQTQNKLVVYAYSSFVASWGVGPALQTLFKDKTGAELKLVDIGDTGLVITKMDKEGLGAADVWLGLDSALAAEAADRFKWWAPKVPGFSYMDGLNAAEIEITGMTAFDWSPLAFVYNSKKIKNPQFTDILAGKFKGKVTAPEPSLSPLGLELVRWLAARTDKFEPLERLRGLKNAEFLFGRSWSQSYGLFQKGEALLSWSFLTSPVYHWVEEKDESIQPLIMAEGHPFIVEYFGIPMDCNKKELAQKFVEILLSSEVQTLIMKKNYMYPVRGGLLQGTRFSELPTVKLVSPLIEPDAALALWKTVQ